MKITFVATRLPHEVVGVNITHGSHSPLQAGTMLTTTTFRPRSCRCQHVKRPDGGISHDEPGIVLSNRYRVSAIGRAQLVAFSSARARGHHLRSSVADMARHQPRDAYFAFRGLCSGRRRLRAGGGHRRQGQRRAQMVARACGPAWHRHRHNDIPCGPALPR